MNKRDTDFYAGLFLALFALAVAFRLYLRVVGYSFFVPILDPILEIIWAIIGEILHLWDSMSPKVHSGV